MRLLSTDRRRVVGVVDVECCVSVECCVMVCECLRVFETAEC